MKIVKRRSASEVGRSRFKNLFQQVEQNFSKQQDIGAYLKELTEASQSWEFSGDTTQVEQLNVVRRMESKIASGRETRSLLYLEDGSEINGKSCSHISTFASSDSASGILLPSGINSYLIKGSDIASKIDKSQSLKVERII